MIPLPPRRTASRPSRTFWPPLSEPMSTCSAARVSRASLLACVLAATLVGLAGCDSGGTDLGDELLVPNTSGLAFQAERGERVTLDLTLVYQNLTERPAPANDLSAPYAIERGEETGSPADGSTTFSVTFVAPAEGGSFVRPLVFRAGAAAATVRLSAQAVGGAEIVTDFSDGEAGFFAFGGGLGLSVEDGQLRIDASNVGGSGVYPGIALAFDAPIDFGATPVVAVRMRAEADGDPVRVRAALNQAGDLPDANATVPDLLADVPADGEYRTYYFDFRDNFVQYDGAPVDPTNIGELVLLFNDNLDPAFTNTLFIDAIERRPDIPSSDG